MARLHAQVKVPHVAAVTGDQGGHAQANHLLFTVLQHDVVVAFDKIIPAAGQGAQRAHGIRVCLTQDVSSELIAQARAEQGLAAARAPLTTLKADRQERERRVGETGRQG